MAYNTCIRKSKQPWGYVSKDGIHDILALEKAEREEGGDGKAKKGWTFRRTDNLRLWAGCVPVFLLRFQADLLVSCSALKLRYMLPIQVPTQSLVQNSGPGGSLTPLGSPVRVQRFPSTSTEPPIIFDGRVVARKEDGWEDMLESVLFRWVDKVVEERRSIR